MNLCLRFILSICFAAPAANACDAIGVSLKNNRVALKNVPSEHCKTGAAYSKDGVNYIIFDTVKEVGPIYCRAYGESAGKTNIPLSDVPFEFCQHGKSYNGAKITAVGDIYVRSKDGKSDPVFTSFRAPQFCRAYAEKGSQKNISLNDVPQEFCKHGAIYLGQKITAVGDIYPKSAPEDLPSQHAETAP